MKRRQQCWSVLNTFTTKLAFAKKWIWAKIVTNMETTMNHDTASLNWGRVGVGVGVNAEDEVRARVCVRHASATPQRNVLEKAAVMISKDCLPVSPLET